MGDSNGGGIGSHDGYCIRLLEGVGVDISLGGVLLQDGRRKEGLLV
jgi:hypothetical protein